MHGVIFSSFRDYVTDAHGRSATEAVFAESRPYLLSEAYADEELIALIERAVAVTGKDADVLVYEFGVFTAGTTFTRLYPAFFAIAGSAREFLLTVETRIHELVRATIPNATPPHLTVTARGESGVSIDYTSPRRLCVLLRGLLDGTVRHYGESATVVEARCMHQGDDRCTFDVALAPVAGE